MRLDSTCVPHVCHSAGTLREEADDPEDDPAEDDPEDAPGRRTILRPIRSASTRLHHLHPRPPRRVPQLRTSASSSSTLDPDASSSTRPRSSAAMASSASCCAAPARVRAVPPVRRALLPPHRVGHRPELVPEVVVAQPRLERIGRVQAERFRLRARRRVDVPHHDVRAEEHSAGDGGEPSGWDHARPVLKRAVQRRLGVAGAAQGEGVELAEALEAAEYPRRG